jgi:lipoyl(octanoyl) transferase
VLNPIRIIDLGRLAYSAAYDVQLAHHSEILAALPRGEPDAEFARILLVEHDPPVITISRRPGSRANLLATDAMLAAAGVEVAETDRGGDITYHGPGQLVAYPIVDLNRLKMGLHEYMRLLESAVIETCAVFGVPGERDRSATGVWVGSAADSHSPRPPPAKIAAMGVRVRRWVMLHGLALNVTTNLRHFDLIVPCGLIGRPVTSLERELGPDRCPTMDRVKHELAAALARRLDEAIRAVAER